MRNLFLFLIFMPIFIYGQSTEKGFYQIGCGFSLGYFNPLDINNHIKEAHPEAKQFTLSSDNSKGLFAVNISGKFIYGYVTKVGIGLQGFIDGSVATEQSVNEVRQDKYELSRMTEGLKLTYRVPLKKHIFFNVGLGPTYNKVTFHENSKIRLQTKSIGGKLSAELQFQFGSFAPIVFLDIDVLNAEAIDRKTQQKMHIDYSGCEIGIAISGIFTRENN